MDLELFRQCIESRLAALDQDGEAGREACAVVELDQTRVGRLSRMDALQGQAMAQATDRRRLQQIAALQAALARIEKGDYGECAVCGEAIAEGRLRADPASTLCLACASAREQV